MSKKHRDAAQPALPLQANDDLPWKEEIDTALDSKPAKSWGEMKKCYHGHKPFEVAPGKFIHGGSCCMPAVHDADIYIGFDGGMKWTSRHYPWNTGTEIFMRIPDGAAPPEHAEFKALVSWAADQINAGKKVHAGCIGGHGRTGMFLAALRKLMANDDNATQTVRTQYCEKVVETAPQVDYLASQWGIAKVKPYREMKTWSGMKNGQAPAVYQTASGGIPRTGSSAPVAQITHVRVRGSIWANEVENVR